MEDLEKRIRDRIFNGHSEAPEEHRPIPFAPCPPSSSRPQRRSQIPVRLKSYRETGQFLNRRNDESECQTFKLFRLLISCCVRDKPSNQSLHIAKTHLMLRCCHGKISIEVKSLTFQLHFLSRL